MLDELVGEDDGVELAKREEAHDNLCGGGLAV
jgi:hypothetical protein